MENSLNYNSILRRRANAVAFVNGSDKYPDIHGRILFYQLNGGVIVRADITGLPSGDMPCRNPVFGLHIHDGERCTGNASDAFADAGTHYNPHNCPHPHHAGDLPPLFGSDGMAFSAFFTNRFNVPDVIGKTVIVHSHPDDFTTQPSGNSGEKMACGVITPSER